jgi:triosephosphate isomerase
MKYIYANWKMYLDYEESITLAKDIIKFKFDSNKIDLAIFPSFLAISEILKLRKNFKIKIGSQDFDFHDKGAFTGEVSIESLKKLGTNVALVGHSERRNVFGEDEKSIKNKFKTCLEKNITAVLCVGEKLSEKKQKKTRLVLKKQLKNILNELSLKNKFFIVAYEPVWSIGSGMACDPEEANETIKFIKEELKKYTDKKIPVLYGGSVSFENVKKYIDSSFIDGVLVGSESSKKENFLKLLKEV